MNDIQKELDDNLELAIERQTVACLCSEYEDFDCPGCGGTKRTKPSPGNVCVGFEVYCTCIGVMARERKSGNTHGVNWALDWAVRYMAAVAANACKETGKSVQELLEMHITSNQELLAKRPTPPPDTSNALTLEELNELLKP